MLDIAIRYEVMGMSPDDIISALLHLNHAQIHDALSYYYDHKDEIDKQWKETLKEIEALRKKLPFCQRVLRITFGGI